MTCPVIIAASSPASSRTKRAIASGDEIPSGDSCRSLDLSSSEIHPVSVGPGSTALTVMPHPASSELSAILHEVAHQIEDGTVKHLEVHFDGFVANGLG
jgi:hypothetical protein